LTSKAVPEKWNALFGAAEKSPQQDSSGIALSQLPGVWMGFSCSGEVRSRTYVHYCALSRLIPFQLLAHPFDTFNPISIMLPIAGGKHGNSSRQH
jgi:hypothetical protein